MYSKLIKNDIRKSKLITATITAFILAAAMLTSLAVSLAVNLSGAIDNMLNAAKTMDFMQMHSGGVDMEQIRGFAEQSASVENYQVLPFLNIEGAEIVIGEESLEWSLQDDGFTVQGEGFDLLLDLNNEVITPSDGELYVPVYYMLEGAASLGDKATVCGVDFTVAGFVRDSSMSQALMSSKRFLVSEADLEKLLPFGAMEHLIEFKLKEGVASTDFEAEYFNANLPSNGPPVVTYALIRLMNGMTDGIMIAGLALIIILVVVVAFLCIRLTLLAKIEEDYREIGVLKAVGMRVNDIKKLYLAKYGVIAGIACLLGFLLSIPLQKPFMRNIQLYMGDIGGGTFILGLAFGLAGGLVIYGAVLLYVNGVLRRFKKISAAQAIRFGATQEKSKSARGFKLSNNRLLSRNIFLGVKDVLARKKLYFTMLTVLVISSFIMIVPQNIRNTISDRSFMAFMGMGICDFNMEIKSTQTGDIAQQGTEMTSVVASDENVEKYAVTTGMMFDRIADDGTTHRMRVSLGDHTIFPIVYSEGRSPQTDDEISISNMYADDLEKTMGDEIVLVVDGAEKRLTICGIYSDVTSGGRTARAVFTPQTGDILGISIAGEFRDGADIPAHIAQYEEALPYTKIYGYEDTREQTLGAMLDAVNLSAYAAVGAAALLTVLVTLLFMKMLAAKDRYPISVLKSLGFNNTDIQKQYLTRAVIVLALGVIVGTVLANTLGEYAGAALVSSFGASTFDFVINPWFAYVFAPLLITLCVYAATVLGTSDIGKLKISEHIKEA